MWVSNKEHNPGIGSEGVILINVPIHQFVHSLQSGTILGMGVGKMMH